MIISQVRNGGNHCYRREGSEDITCMYVLYELKIISSVLPLYVVGYNPILKTNMLLLLSGMVAVYMP